jgi:lipopolysaccharide export system permease protein
MVMTDDKENLILTLYSGSSYSEYLDTNKRIDKNRKFQRTQFASQQLLFALPGDSLKRTDEEIYKDNYMMKTMKGLISYSNELRIDMNRKRDRVAKDLMLTQYFRLEDKKEEPTPLTEEQQTLAAKRIDIQALYDSLPLVRKAEVASHALMLAKGAQNMVTNSLETSKSDLRWINRHMIEWHRKLTLSIACLIFFLIGAPLGSIIRKGGLGTPVVVSTLFFIFYHIISLAGEKYARAGILPVWLGMWGSSILLLPLGIFLTFKSTRDSAIMVGESYTILIRKILSFGRRLGLARNEDPPANQ